ncbi:MAG: N-6 DNA methylase, partial [Planctomycetaceae bacterium]|jgi:predicted helicase|nr:N-6 DNA methylase [Planctomycetaceae bacterium]
MQNYLNQYIAEVNGIYQTGNATEHSYRPALQLLLQRLLENVAADLTVTNEPKRIECGAPDYIVAQNEIPIGYIEAKDVGTNLDAKDHKEQFDRYRHALGNLIITDYLTFRLFENGELVTTATIGEIADKEIRPIASQYDAFAEIINAFANYKGTTIHSSELLSKTMAVKARLMASILDNVLNDGEHFNGELFNSNGNGNGNSLAGQLEGFREVLIHNVSTKEFADIYAQTIAYGMFAARLHDSTDDKFSRTKAADLIPKSNPFLRKLFQYIAGYDLDKRIRWVVDALADLFNYIDVGEILGEFSKLDHDPIIHFYETFLAEYDPALRKSRGVWYTPKPVVQFIVQAVNDLLKEQFDLPQGLSDTSKIRQDKTDYHRVQILDPAAGTGTFLAEVVRTIYQQQSNQQGLWNGYVNDHLIPRLNGFEILMASYAMAHFKLEMMLKETGYTDETGKRLRIFLTNSLEEAHDKIPRLPFVQWLSDEANAASQIKRDTPVMVVLGNPPYSGVSQNKGEWMLGLIEDYKYIAKTHFDERKHWLQDDYVKFIRYGQHFIDKNGAGILAYINNHGFLDNPTFRGMRWNLLQTFDTIYIVDLHGNSKKKETAPDGSKDDNVFDIQQGVSINIFVKSGKKEAGKLADVFHYDLYGKRQLKYNFLLNNNLKTVKWTKLPLKSPQYFFVQKDFRHQKKYEKGFAVNQLLKKAVTGVVTMGDSFIIADDKTVLINRIKKLAKGAYSEDQLNNQFGLGKNYAKWISQNKAQINFDESMLVKINYRPFDEKWTYFDNKLIWRWRVEIMKHFLNGENVGLVVARQAITNNWSHVQVSNTIIDNRIHYSNKGIPMLLPLYCYPDSDDLVNDKKRTPNLDMEIVNKIASKIGLTFTSEKEAGKKTFAPIDLLDYIYAVLHNPAYRERYKEFLKIDFPRVPYPDDVTQFRQLVTTGAKLRRLHLLEGVEPRQGMADYPIAGTNEVEKTEYVGNKVWINRTQYFDNVPPESWEFYIGGYQPAQKWLKDRKKNILNYDAIRHYQRIIVALTETQRLIDTVYL